MRAILISVVVLLGLASDALAAKGNQWFHIAATSQAIASVNLSNNRFVGGAPSGTVVGAISVGMSPSSPVFSGALSLSGVNASSFQIVGSNLETSGVVPTGTYQINIVAIQAGVSNSPFPSAVQITGTSPTLVMPTGLPNRFALGVASKGIGTSDLSWMTGSGVAWDYRYNQFPTVTDNSPGTYVSDSVNNSIIPIIHRYTGWNNTNLTNLTNTAFMAAYYADFVAQLKSMLGWNLWYSSSAGSTYNTIATDGSVVTHTSATSTDSVVVTGNPHTTGKWVFRIHVNNIAGVGHDQVGMARKAVIGFDQYLGQSVSSFGITATGLFINNTVVNAQPAITPTTGHDIDIAVDLGIQRIWARDNGGSWNGNAAFVPGDANGIFYGTGGANGANGLAAGQALGPAVNTYYQNDAYSFGTTPTITGFSAWNSSPVNPPMVMALEQDLWPFMQQQGGPGGSQTDNAANVAASVASSGYAGLSGLPNTAAGFAQALKLLRDQNAPNVIMGPFIGTYGPNDGFVATNASFNEPPATTGQRMANFYNTLGTQFDLVFHDTTTGDQDSDFGILVGFGGYPHTAAFWWWGATAFENYRQLLASFHSTLLNRTPGFLIQLPIGNTLYQSVNDTAHHYQDNKAEFWLTAGAGVAQGAVYDPTARSNFLQADIAGLLFGTGQANTTDNYDYAGDGITNPGTITNQNGWSGNTKTATVSDDDGGFLRLAGANYYVAPVPINGTITGITLSSSSFTCGTAGTVGAITVQGNNSGAVLTLTGADAAQFSLSSTTVPSNLTVGTSPAGCPRTYNLNIVATLANATGSPFTQAENITGNSAATFPLTVTAGVLTTQGGTPYLLYGDAPQGANNLPLCSTGNTYALCSVAPGANDTLAGGQHTFLAYLKDRKAQGFNSLWINILCELYTQCTNSGANQEGTFPFTAQLSGAVHSPDTCPEGSPPSNVDCWDMASGINVNGTATGANAAYWAHVDGYFLLAADQGMQILANPVPTDGCQSQNVGTGGSFAFMFLNNNAQSAAKITGFADFLANRYKNTPNLVWFLFNDYACWNASLNPSNFISGADTVFYNFALRLVTDENTSGGFKHLVTSELYGDADSLSDNVNTWSNVITLNGVYYNSGPTYDGGLMSRGQSATAPAILVEGAYLGEDLNGVDDGTNSGTQISGCGTLQIVPSGQTTLGNTATCPIRERTQFWKLLLTSAAGYVNGNSYSWQLNVPTATTNWFASGNPSGTCTGTLPQACLDVPANAQLLAAAAFLKANSWYKLVPDYTRSVNGSNFGIGVAIAGPFINASTGCYGNPCTNYYGGSNVNDLNSVPKGQLFDRFVTSGAASDGSFAMAYVQGINPGCTYPNGLTNCVVQAGQNITVNDGKVNGGANITAAWYDPTGAMTSGTIICQPSGVPATCAAGSHTYTTPAGLHADGTADWVLLVSATPVAPSFVSVGPAPPSFTAPSTSGATLEALVATMSSGSFTGSYSLTSANGGCASADNASFAISGSNLNFAAVLGAGTYHICVRATQAGASNSPFDTAFTITGTSGTPTAYLSAANLETSSLNSGVSTTIPNGGSALLTWDSANAATCTSTDFTTGNSPGIGTVTVSPTTTTTYHLTCGSASTTAQVIVSGTRRDAAAGVGTAGCAGSGTSGSPWNYLCIQNAVNAAAAGDTIFLRGGNWALNTTTDAGPVTVNKVLSFVGASSGNALDTYGHISNGNGTSDCPTAGTVITCIYVNGTSFAYGSNPSDKGTIKVGLDAGGGSCNNRISHIQFSANVTDPGGDDEGLLNFEYCPGPVTLTDIRFYTAGNSSFNAETELYTQGVSNVTVQNSFLGIPLFSGAYGTGQAYESILSNGITLRNNVFWQGFYNPTDDENILYTGNIGITDLNNYGGPGFGPTGCHLDPGNVGGLACPTSGGLDGTFHATFSNNYQKGGPPGFVMAPGVNDPNTNGAVSDLHYTGNWLTGSNLAIDACIWNIFAAEGNCSDNGMIINAAATAAACVTSWNGSPFAITNNNIIGTATAQLNAGAKGTTHCWATGDPSGTPHTVNLATYGFDAEKNYLQSPSNQYNFNGQTFSPTVIGNYCDNAGHSGASTFTQTDSSTCATTGFTSTPTASFSLGTLSNGVVQITSPTFTAQYGAVQWLASTSPTTPLASDVRWTSVTPSAANTYVPPVSLAVSHGNTVYLWVMDSLGHIGAATPQAVP